MSLHVCPNPQNVQHQVNPDGNNGLWVMTMCQGRVLSPNKMATLVGDVCNGGCACVRAGGI